MKRVIWKLPYIKPVLLKNNKLKKKNLKFSFRNSIIPHRYLDKRVSIYNGIWFLSKEINKNMIGLKLGELSFTKRCDTQLHIRKKSKKKSKKK